MGLDPVGEVSDELWPIDPARAASVTDDNEARRWVDADELAMVAVGEIR